MPIHNSRTSRTQHQSALVLLSFGCLCARCYGPLVWWFGFFSFGYSCVSYRNPHLGSFQPPKLGLEGLDKLNLFQSLTLLEPTQNFNRSTVSFWVLEEGYLLMIWIMAHTTRLCFTTYLNTIQFFFIRCRTKLVLEHANCKDAVFTRFEDANIGPNSQRPCFTRAMVSMENKSCHNTEIRKQPTRTHRNLICSLEVTVWKRSIVYLCLACLADKNL